MPRIGIHQVVTGLSYGDAITHHALAIRQAIRSWGFDSELFAEQIGEEFLGESLPLIQTRHRLDPRDVLIFHHSIHSTAVEMITAVANPVILIYHNITPAKFFRPYNTRYTALLERGRQELSDLVPRVTLALGDSEWNRAELESMGFPKTGVLPIVFQRGLYQSPPNRVIRKLYRDGYVNILAVGRIVPQKRLENLISMFAMYRRWVNNKSRLILVGEHRGFEAYFHGLLDLVDRLRLGEVHFIGLVPFRELLAWYSVADVLVSASEHEGFCVPLLEGIHFRLPVIARACGAVPETLGDAGILYHDEDPLFLAELIHAVLRNDSLRTILHARANRVLEKFSADRSLSILRTALEKVMVPS